MPSDPCREAFEKWKKSNTNSNNQLSVNLDDMWKAAWAAAIEHERERVFGTAEIQVLLERHKDAPPLSEEQIERSVKRATKKGK